MDESIASLVIDVARTAVRSRLARHRVRICLADCEELESDVVLELWSALQRPHNLTTGRAIQAFAGRIASCRIKDYVRSRAGDGNGGRAEGAKYIPAVMPNDAKPMVSAVAPTDDDEPSLLAQCVAQIDQPRLRIAAYALMEGGEFTDIAAELGIDRRSLSRLREKLRHSLAAFDPAGMEEEDERRIAQRRQRIENRQELAALLRELETAVVRSWMFLHADDTDDCLIGALWDRIVARSADPMPSWIAPPAVDSREDTAALARRRRINSRIGIGDIPSSIDHRPTGRPAHPRPISGRLLRQHLAQQELQAIDAIVGTARPAD